MTGLAQLAARLRALHHGPEPLVLPNAWDAATARAVVDAGFPAVATTSSGVSAALGYADGEHTPADEMFDAVQRITRVVPDVPVTADIESGYGLSPEDLVERLLAAGAVGCNLEDTDHHAAPGSHTLVDAATQQHRLQAVKQAARARGVDIVLNARTDVFLGQSGSVDEAVRRAKLYLEAGADAIFPIGAPDEPTIVALVTGISAPVNVIAGFRGAPGLARLREIGVRRISYAGRLHRAMLIDHQRRLAGLKEWQDL
ncbi:MAG: isocitrate lyase/phosphoenolpyruvate mutase family protein [Chloroflexi bacterium]|nr:isocitrate lyase/phosphoenolpyruvate mutase family protein [Chloroflexota bacterium]